MDSPSEWDLEKFALANLFLLFDQFRIQRKTKALGQKSAA